MINKIKNIISNENISNEIKVLAIKGIIAETEKYASDNNYILRRIYKKFDFNSDKYIRYSPTEISKIIGTYDFKLIKITLKSIGINQYKSDSQRYYLLPILK